MVTVHKAKRGVLGFTLVELMIVIVIVGILAAVAIPRFVRSADKARASEFPTVLTGIYTQQEAYKAERGFYLTGFDSLSIPDPNPSNWFTYTNTSTDSVTFIAKAQVKERFGNATTSDTAAINQAGAKTATATLLGYVPSWK